MNCKNCKHKIIETTNGWSHEDSHKQPTGICLQPDRTGKILMCCNCKNPETIIRR